MNDPLRPYPDGIAFDEAWRQRQRANAAEATTRREHEAIGTFLQEIGAFGGGDNPVETLIAYAREWHSAYEKTVTTPSRAHG